jgi:hypothetical protein
MYASPIFEDGFIDVEEGVEIVSPPSTQDRHETTTLVYSIPITLGSWRFAALIKLFWTTQTDPL